MLQADAVAVDFVDYSTLFAAVEAQIDSGIDRACGIGDRCVEMGGCPRCFRAVMTGIDIAKIDIFREANVIRFTMAEGCGEATPCTVSFRGASVQVHK